MISVDNLNKKALQELLLLLFKGKGNEEEYRYKIFDSY